LKHVQDALYESKIQGVIPQRVDERTLKMPIPKCASPSAISARALSFSYPSSRLTVEARLAAYSNASKLAEEARVQIRRQHQASVKKGKYSRHSTEHHEVCAFLEVSLASKCNEWDSQFQKLQDRHIAEVDTVLARIKRSTGAR
jgi:ribosome recycling factor